MQHSLKPISVSVQAPPPEDETPPPPRDRSVQLVSLPCSYPCVVFLRLKKNSNKEKLSVWFRDRWTSAVFLFCFIAFGGKKKRMIVKPNPFILHYFVLFWRNAVALTKKIPKKPTYIWTEVESLPDKGTLINRKFIIRTKYFHLIITEQCLSHVQLSWFSFQRKMM